MFLAFALPLFFQAAAATTAVEATPPPPPPARRLDYIMIVWGENKKRSDAIAQPYLASLATNYAQFTNYRGVTHPSQPNYFTLTSGNPQVSSNVGCTSLGATNLADRLEAAGLDWRQYNESMVTACSDTTLYVSKHDFFVNYTNVRTNPTRLAKIRGFNASQQATYSELLGPNPPAVVFVSPNMCNGAHDCTLSTFNGWLAGTSGSTFFQDMLSSKYFTDGAIIVSFDEDDGTAGNNVYFAAIGDRAIPGFSSAAFRNHYSFLRTIEDNFGLATMTSNDAAASNMLDAFYGLPSEAVNWDSY